jgi:hypothetical protein
MTDVTPITVHRVAPCNRLLIADRITGPARTGSAERPGTDRHDVTLHGSTGEYQHFRTLQDPEN